MMATSVRCARLPMHFDEVGLLRDLAGIDACEWVPHFNSGDYDGEWSGVALRAVDGRAELIYPDPTATGRYADTPVLARSPHFQEVVSAFECELTSVRLLRLGARSSIREHRDFRLSHAHGEVRIHVPIVTSDQVAFFLDGERVRMRAGEAWYLDVELPHRVDNASDTERVHLVLDCVANGWLDAMFPAACAAVAAPAPVVPRRSRDDAELHGSLAVRIAAFLRDIGLVVAAGPATHDTVVPGIRIEGGALVVDEPAMSFPGDLLHEAGHLAVVPPARRAGLTGAGDADPAEEMMAIGWSYAAALHLGIDPALVFHSGGYRGGSESLLENFAEGRYIGVPMLQWVGLTYDEREAAAHGAEPYPAMRHWLRTTG